MSFTGLNWRSFAGSIGKCTLKLVLFKLAGSEAGCCAGGERLLKTRLYQRPTLKQDGKASFRTLCPVGWRRGFLWSHEPTDILFASSLMRRGDATHLHVESTLMRQPSFLFQATPRFYQPGSESEHTAFFFRQTQWSFPEMEVQGCPERRNACNRRENDHPIRMNFHNPV